jgi:WD40 repeat protein
MSNNNKDSKITVNNSLVNLKLKDNAHSRALKTIPDEEKNSFLVGITSNNISEISRIDYDEENKKLSQNNLVTFSSSENTNDIINEVLDIYPLDKKNFYVQIFNSNQNEYQLKYCKYNEESNKYEIVNCEILKSKTIFDINFNNENLNNIYFITNNKLEIIDIQNNKSINSIQLYENSTNPLKISNDISFSSLSNTAIGINNDIFLCDLKSNKISMNIKNTHESNILSLQYDPSSPFILCSSGTDNAIKFWDLRKPEREIGGVYDNSHWIWSCKFNQNYTNMLVTGSSSSMVRNIIFNKQNELEIDNLNNNNYYKNIKEYSTIEYSEFEDSVYAVDWSKNDSWTFGAISFNSFFHINTIPEEVKYQIML